VASVLGVFSQSKLLVLRRPSDGVVELTGGALVMGGGQSALARCEEERSRGVDEEHSVRARRQGEWKKPSALHAPFIAMRGGERQRAWQRELWAGNGDGVTVQTGRWICVVCTRWKKALAFPSGGSGG
jgi:hypothetical protein